MLLEYENFDLVVEGGDDLSFVVKVESPAGQVEGDFRFPFKGPDLELKLKDFEIALLRSSGSPVFRLGPLTQAEQTVRALGGTLFNALIHDDVNTCYRLSREQARHRGRGLRLRLRIQPAHLAALPWEYMFDAHEGEFVCLSVATPIVRYPEVLQAVAPITVEPPLRILGMTASPEDLPAVSVESPEPQTIWSHWSYEALPPDAVVVRDWFRNGVLFHSVCTDSHPAGNGSSNTFLSETLPAGRWSMEISIARAPSTLARGTFTLHGGGSDTATAESEPCDVGDISRAAVVYLALPLATNVSCAVGHGPAHLPGRV